MCKYKDIFGKPKTGVHKIRLFNIAFIDFIFTLLGAQQITQCYSAQHFIPLIEMVCFLEFHHR